MAIGQGHFYNLDLKTLLTTQTFIDDGNQVSYLVQYRGLISNTKNNSMQGVPYLDKIPFLGNAFAYKTKSSRKTELVIIITPKSVIKNI